MALASSIAFVEASHRTTKSELLPQQELGPRRPPTPDVGNCRWTNPKKTTAIFDTIYISIHQTRDLKTRVISSTPMARWTPITHRNSRDL
ncbi:unnamed protein product [Brassica oleracea]|uniref:(rape) hypothetical protein n=1 Tax=Brassica napus TaxID=3708 RepID=A0A816LK54_BRANA|nr:unnamed protein product [Brassica napus]